MAGTVTGSDWKQEKRGLRRREVRDGSRAIWIQAVALGIAGVAAIAAAYAAVAAGTAVRDSAQYNAQQAVENQLTTAVSAIGGSSSAEQVAGLILLRRNVTVQVNDAVSTSDALTRENAVDAVDTALEVIGDYVHTDPMNDGSFQKTVDSKLFGLGYGYPSSAPEPFSVIYAADELHLLLGLAREVRRIDGGQAPSVDLSDVQLYGTSLSGINFGWLHRAYMPFIDLRGSNLTGSVWGRGTTLRHAYLQCADLSGADFRGADLTNANLSGADLSGANFTGAILTGVKTNGAFGHPKGLVVTKPASRFRQLRCELNQKVKPKKPKAKPKTARVKPPERKARRRRSPHRS
jgi:hypothetical protein